METFIKKLQNIKKKTNTLKKMKYGIFLYKLLLII